MENNPLQESMLTTYFSLRMGMFLIALATPFIVVGWGLAFGVPWQTSISAYYFAPFGNHWEYSYYPCRVFFVGILFALGTFLYLYKGLSKSENRALNVAGGCAIGVAVFPMYAEQGYISFSGYAHFTFAIILFLCMAYTAIVHCDSTLKYLENRRQRERYRRAYHVIGWFMAVFPITGVVLAWGLQVQQDRVYWMEAAGIWAFAAYWLLKTFELRASQAEVKAVQGTLPPPESD